MLKIIVWFGLTLVSALFTYCLCLKIKKDGLSDDREFWVRFSVTVTGIFAFTCCFSILEALLCLS